jgi:hypothetical protein
MSRTIRSVDDLAQLPDSELLACLGALRSAIHQARRQHADALRERQQPVEQPFHFHTFDWRPRGAQRFSMPAQLSPETPIEEISMRAAARVALKRLNIFCIDDLSAINEQELLQEEAIGAKTVGRLREALTRVGLDFLPDAAAPEAGATSPGARIPVASGFGGVHEHFGDAPSREREGGDSENMDWMGMYAYPSQLLKLAPGDAGVFVCPPAWRGRLATVCGVWIKANADWAAAFPAGTPWKAVFRTEAHADGLQVVRSPVPGRQPRSKPRQFVFRPLVEVPLLDGGPPRLDQVVSLWGSPQPSAPAPRRKQPTPAERARG